MGRLLTILLLLVLLALLIFMCLRTHPTAIESALTGDANGALSRKGWDWASSTLDGRDVTLTGMAPTQQDRLAAAVLVGNVRGVRVVDNQIEVAPPPLPVREPVAPVPAAPEPEPAPAVTLEPFGFRAALDGDVLTLTGRVPNQAQRESIVTYATGQFPSARVVDQLQIDAQAPAGWREGVDVGLTQLARLSSGRLALDATDWNLTGMAPDADTRSSISDIVDADVPDPFATQLRVEVPASTAQVDQCQDDFNALMASNRILFQTSKAQIDEASTRLLNQLSEVAARCVAVIQIEGHTDSRGAEASNLLLSQRRADAVRDYLLAQGVPQERIVAQGYGEEHPVADNDTPAGRAQNRRIEFKVEKIAP